MNQRSRTPPISSSPTTSASFAESPNSINSSFQPAINSLNCPMLPLIPSIRATSVPSAPLINISAMQKDLEYYQSAYFSLKAHFDEVCDIVKSTPSQAEVTKQLKKKDAQIQRLTEQVQSLKYELQTIKNEQSKKDIKEETLQDLYLSSKQIKKFMASIKNYGHQFENVKKRQFDLTKTIGRDNYKSIKNNINDIYRDIVQTEESYHLLYECLDVMKTESEGKELELMTKDKHYIALLENEKLIQSSYMEDYVKKNQKLQSKLTDSEMKLRQTQNRLNMMLQQQTNYQQHLNIGDCNSW